MMLPSLTNAVRGASPKHMEKIWKTLLTLSAAAGLAGCVNVAAPERPIEINLNITIRQEVVVRLQQDAQQLIQNNPGVF
jgi:hypothetical protein